MRKLFGNLGVADDIGADTLKYLPVSALARCVGLPSESLCQACVNTVYPTPAGERMYQKALVEHQERIAGCGNGGKRTWDHGQ